ncbi:hypothetical protein [Lactobacillus amylovorus]|uniref:hypothetical protein n=1 Tax=Lactobacillus amylovorus TaxID=1604 RepID=UPI0030B4E32C
MGESAGEPRHVSSPRAAVDYLGVKVPFVDRGKIGVIGICGSALSAASVDALPETDPITNEWQRFYAVPCNFHPNARGWLYYYFRLINASI